MIERNAILINGGSAADVDRTLTAVAAALVAGLSPPNAERAEALTPNSEAFAVRIPRRCHW
jgi:hypothetical protein